MPLTNRNLMASLSGNTAGVLANISTGTMYFAGGNNITLSQDANSVTISGGAGGAGYTAGLSNIGNTAGDTGAVTGRLVFAGGDNVTLSGSTNAGSMTITISGAAGGAAGSNTLGMSNIGNTSGTTGVVSGTANRFLFAGGNNVTLSQSLNGVSGTVTISAGGGPNTLGMSNIGNTSGTTGVVSENANQFLFAGGNNVTLSQSLNGASGTVTISGANAGAQNMIFWQNMGVNGSATDAMAQSGTSHGQLKFFQLDIGNNIFAGNMTVSTMLIDVTVNRTATIGNFTWFLDVGIYSQNGSILSLVFSASTSIGSSNSMGSNTISNSMHGKRYLTLNGTQFSTVHSTTTGGGATLTLSQGLYYMGLLPRSSSNTFSMSWFGAILGESGQRSGTIGLTKTVGTSAGAFPYMGCMTATQGTLVKSTVDSGIMKTNLEAIFIPHIVFNNIAQVSEF